MKYLVNGRFYQLNYFSCKKYVEQGVVFIHMHFPIRISVLLAKHRVALSKAWQSAALLRISENPEFAHNVGKTLRCAEYNRPRVMYAACKVRFRDQLKLETVLDDIMYTCGVGLQECIPVCVYH